jgi:hypothetical protein
MRTKNQHLYAYIVEYFGELIADQNIYLIGDAVGIIE